jgi:hypothetical protein
MLSCMQELVLLVFRNDTCLNLVLVNLRYYSTCWGCCLLHVELTVLLACLIMWARSIVLIAVLVINSVALLKLGGKNCNCRPLFLVWTILSAHYFMLKIPWWPCVVSIHNYVLRLPKKLIFLNVTFRLILFCLNLICTLFQIIRTNWLIFLMIKIVRWRRSIIY